MAKSIFSKQHEGDPNIKRNTFDLSFANSLTMEMGKLYPVFCKEVLPGDTFRIDSAFGLRFMPMAFPVQTKMRANLQFFYVRNRNLWNKWQQFITKTGQPDEFPYVKASTYCKTNDLGDFFGIPTTLISRGVPVHQFASDSVQGVFSGSIPSSDYSYSFKLGYQYKDDYSSKVVSVSYPAVPSGGPGFTGSSYFAYWFHDSENVPFQVSAGNRLSFNIGCTIVGDSAGMSEQSLLELVRSKLRFALCYPKLDGSSYKVEQYDLSEIRGFEINSLRKYTESGVSYVVNFRVDFFSSVSFDLSPDLCLLFYSSPENPINDFIVVSSSSVASYGVFNEDSIISGDWTISKITSEAHFELSPSFMGVYAPENSDATEYSNYNISVLPFRAYESIYNAFYRDDRNNPYVVNGVSDPNVYLPTKDGGLDTNDYVLHRVNWEQDFLTTAVPSPQQGPAPLVGVTSTGQATFMDADGTEYKAQFKVGSDGDTVESVDFPDANIPSSARQTAIALATEGISINDFRNVNALQRWLETNMRKGYKYKDQIASHFGVNISYAELDMPEFIGGVSQLADIAQINQTSASTDTDPLGSYAGQASVVGGNNHTISTYCDEHGFIIGLFYVVPTPTYSQLLPKHFLKFDPMDYFFPEFGHLGYQPIKYDEVCPVQALASGVSLADTYGYQRAWYDYLQSVDEVHGDFRTTLQSFILSRVFKSVPSLNPDFLTVSQDQLNEIFTVTEVNGEPIRPILGQLYFDVLAKRKIPRYGVPRLE